MIRAQICLFENFGKNKVLGKGVGVIWMHDGPEGYVPQLENTIKNLTPANLKRFCNKPTSFYWMQPAQSNGHFPGLVLIASIKSGGSVIMMIIPLLNLDVSSRVQFRLPRPARHYFADGTMR